MRHLDKQLVSDAVIMTLIAVLLTATIVLTAASEEMEAKPPGEPLLEYFYPDNEFTPSETIVIIVENPTDNRYTLEFSWKAYDGYNYEIGNAKLRADVYPGLQVFLAPVRWVINASQQDKMWIYMSIAEWSFREPLEADDLGGEQFVSTEN